MNWKSLLTLPNLVILLSALFIVYKLYGLPQRVDNHDTRITSLEHESIEMKATQQLMLNAVYETRTDIKQIMMKLKLD